MDGFKENEVIYTQRDGQIVDIGLVESVSPLKILTPYLTHLHKPYYSEEYVLKEEWQKSNVISNPTEWFQGSGVFSRNNEIFCIERLLARHISYLFTEIGFETIYGSCSLNEYPDSTFFKITPV